MYPKAEKPVHMLIRNGLSPSIFSVLCLKSKVLIYINISTCTKLIIRTFGSHDYKKLFLPGIPVVNT